MMDANDETDRLIAAYLNGTLSEEDRAAFEQSTRENPDALHRAAEAVRFEMLLADAARPDQLELVQQRRVVIDRASGRPVAVESTQRVGSPGAMETAPPAPKPRGYLLAVSLATAALAGVAIWLAIQDRQRVEPLAVSAAWQPLPLKNHGFETPDLGTPPASSETIPAWQDKFSTPNAKLLALPPGAAHGGKQVALLAPGGHLKQFLNDAAGQPVVFEPGRKLRVSGWVKPEGPVAGHAQVFHLALHHVDERLLQYVVRYQVVPLDGGGWRRFSVEFTVPAQDVFEPSYGKTTNLLATVTGRQILLSITNISFGERIPVPFLLDDLAVEMMEAPAK